MQKEGMITEKQEPQNHSDHIQPSPFASNPSELTQPVISEFFAQYASKTQKMNVSNSNIAQLELRLLKNGIEIDRRNFHGILCAEIINYTSNFQALNIRVCFGYFKMTISVLNVDGLSQCHNFPQLHHNSNSNLFFYEDKFYKKHTIKCFQHNQNIFTEKISSAIKQFCILKIASILKIGPNTSSLLGFDLIIYEDCVEFAMQNCKKIQQINQKSLNLLKQKLALFHAFNLIHMDIKPSNIMFSPSLRQIVFIDFGLSLHIEQKIGFKNRVKFSGSLSYCGKQMRKAYQRNQYHYVDLYFNDLQCLTNTYAETFQREADEAFQPNNYEENELALIILLHFDQYFKKAGLFFTFIQVKYYLFSYLQFKKDILNQKQFVNKYYFALNDFAKKLNNSRYLRYINKLFHQIQLKNGLSYSNINCGFKFQYRPIIDELNDKLQDNMEQTHFIKVARHLLDCKQNQSNRDYCFFSRDNKRKLWLLNEQVVKSIKNVDYLVKSYSGCVDFRKNLSTFQQKVTASILIIKRLGLSTDIQGDQRIVLSSCQKQLLFIYIQTKPSYYQEVIPIFLRNLIILNYLSCQEVIFVVKTVLGDSINSIEKLKLKIRIQIIFSFFNEQNFWHEDSFKLKNNLNCFFQIKIQQPYAAALKCIAEKIICNMCRSSAYLHNSIKNLFQGIYLEDSFIDQIIVWRTIFLIPAYQMNQTISQQFEWNKIEIVYGYHKKYGIQFDFYVFCSLFFPNMHLSHQILKKVYKKLAVCIEREDILKNFMIYYFYWSRQLKDKPIQKQIIYHHQIMTQLLERYQRFRSQSENSFNMKFFLDKRQNEALSQIFFFCVSNEDNDTIRKILLTMKQVITKDILRQVCLKFDSNQDIYIQNFFLNSFGSLFFSLVCFFYWNLYKDEPNLVEQLSLFCNEIERHLSSAVFSNKIMQIHFDYSILLVRIKTYELQDQITLKIQAYEDFILKHLTDLEPFIFINSDFFNRPFILYIHNSIRLDPKFKGLRAVQFYYETVMKYRQFKSLFALQRFNQNWYFLTQYVVFQKDAKTLIYLHNCICLYLLQNPYFNFIRDYIQSFVVIDKYFKYQVRLRECLYQLQSQYKNYLYFANDYIIIFYTFLLSYLQRGMCSPIFIEKLLICISKRVQKLTPYAQKYVLRQLYEYLYLKDSSKLCVNIKYLKLNQKKLSFVTFKKMVNFKYSKLLSRDKVFFRELESKLNRFYDINKN